MNQFSFRNNRIWWIALILILGYTAKVVYQMPKYDSGEQATDFSAVLADGSSFQLSSLRGNYILLDFWGSWCGPCRSENPMLVALYEETRGKAYTGASGFQIVSVAIETNRDRWQRAVEQDGLRWKFHIAEFDRFSSPLAKLYGVREIPTKYLIGPDGNILLVNPQIEEIRQYLQGIEGR